MSFSFSLNLKEICSKKLQNLLFPKRLLLNSPMPPFPSPMMIYIKEHPPRHTTRCFPFTGINFWGMLHHICDVAYDENRSGPIRTHKFRGTNWWINYIESDGCSLSFEKIEIFWILEETDQLRSAPKTYLIEGREVGSFSSYWIPTCLKSVKLIELLTKKCISNYLIYLY